ncbi:hypothetical protein ILUMI_19471, partial [Ignelater luminosus]
SSITNSTEFIHEEDDLNSKQFYNLEVVIDKFKNISGPLLGRTDWLRTDSGKVSSIVQFPTPKTITEIKLFWALLQGEGGNENVVTYASRSLIAAEKNCSATEKEYLGCKKYRPYVELTHFKIATDYSALLWLYKLQSPSATGSVTYPLVDLHGRNLGVWHVKDLKAHREEVEGDMLIVSDHE